MADQPIHDAVARADLDALQRELAKGVSPNALNWDGNSPLHYLCDNSCDSDDDAEAQVACLHVLLEAGANVNALDEYQRTPLHEAAYNNNKDFVAALIKAGADVNRCTGGDFTPLHLVCFRDDRTDVKPALLLLRNGAAVNARDMHGRTPMDYAIRNPRRRRLVPTLLRAGAALPAQTNDAYLQKVIAAGGFRIYERTHLATLTATVKSKLRLPARPARCVAEYALHAGHY